MAALDYLTAGSAKSAQAADREYLIPSRTISGLALRVRPTGSKAFVFAARVKGGPLVKITLGAYGDPWTVRAAEEEAARLRAACRSGIDPRAAAKRAAIARREDDHRVLTTFADAATRYLAAQADGRSPTSKRRRPTPAAVAREALSVRHAVAIIGEVPVGHVGRSDAIRLRDRLATMKGHRGHPLSDSSRRHAFSAAERVLSFALEEGLAETNILAMMKAPHGSEARTRFLSEEEVRAVWTAAWSLPEPYGRLIRFLFAVPVRLGNATDARWRDVHGDLLHLPMTKTGRPWTVALPAIALEVLGPRGADDARLFPSRGASRRNVGGSVYTGMAKVKLALDAVSEVTGWRLHDARRTIATDLSDRVADFNRAAGSLWQQHVPADRMLATYNVSESLPAQRTCAAQWDRELRRILGLNVIAPEVECAG